ncbi:SDR family NAD(P)-dependent oxidoreductase [Microbacterium aurum]
MSSRRALVTGGASGIGRGIALGLAAAGHPVVIADLNLAGASAVVDEIRNAGGSATSVSIDVTDGNSVRDGIATVEADSGPIEVVVNNAGWDDFMPFVATDEDFWFKIVNLNYLGALRVTHAVLPGMIERKWGRVINIGSDAGRVGSSLEAVYSGAKGGIIAFTKTLAREVATDGITANTVCPGPTDTPALRKFADNSGQEADKVISGMTRAVPMKRLGEPGDVAGAVAFFASDSASFITGQTLSVSGGLTMA